MSSAQASVSVARYRGGTGGRCAQRTAAREPSTRRARSRQGVSPGPASVIASTRGDRVGALCLVSLLGGEAHVDVLASDVSGPRGQVEHERSRGRGFGAGVADGRDVPADRGTTRPVRRDAIHEGAGPLAVPSPHGRTRMIVFALRRSVGLNAATASSNVTTLPMFVRTRPSALAGRSHSVGRGRTRERSCRRG
jgi:hypothetical protein